MIIMTDWIKLAMYNAWLLEMWSKGFGTTDQIDKRVNNGELIPGKKYEDISKAHEHALSAARPVKRNIKPGDFK
jgi:hypothetical protein